MSEIPYDNPPESLARTSAAFLRRLGEVSRSTVDVESQLKVGVENR